MSKLHALRDQILESLRCQFAAKVHSIHLVGKGVCIADAPEVDALLRDLANNAAMGLDIDDDETDEEYHEHTGEPRGAGADWAGRKYPDDFSENP